jgi:transcriptional regulator with XRE-family HTH domain
MWGFTMPELYLGLSMNLKSQLRQFLDLRSLTAAQLARRSGVSKSVLSDWLAGVTPRDIQHVKKVATALGTTVDHLCFGEGPEAQSSSASDDFLGGLAEGGWIGGLFEIRFRRVRRKHDEP